LRLQGRATNQVPRLILFVVPLTEATHIQVYKTSKLDEDLVL
jgi:hypothetical protein